MKRKLLAALCVTAMSAGLLAGCGSSDKTDYRTKKLLENEQRSYNYQRERNGIHADRYSMDDLAGDCRHV